MKSKTIHVILASVFAIFACLQYNDKDPFIWIMIYGSVAFVAFLKIYMRQVNFNPLVITLVVIFALYSFTYFPSFIDFLRKPDKLDLFGSMQVKKPWIEGTREFFGLLISIGALIYLRKSKVKRR